MSLDIDAIERLAIECAGTDIPWHRAYISGATRYMTPRAALLNMIAEVRRLRALLDAEPRETAKDELRQICHALGVCYCWDFGCEPGPIESVLARIRELSAYEAEHIEAAAASPRPAESPPAASTQEPPRAKVQGEGPCLCEHADNPRRAHRPDCPAKAAPRASTKETP